MTIKTPAEARKSPIYIRVKHEAVDALRKANKKLKKAEIAFHARRQELENARRYWQCRLIDAEKDGWTYASGGRTGTGDTPDEALRKRRDEKC